MDLPLDTPLLRALAIGWGASLGAVVGSFLNVVIARVPEGRSVVRPRSACPRCGAAIAWYDNVPVLSWLLLGARCRACRAPISARYPLVEALVAALAGAAVARHGLSAAALAELTFEALLVALAFIDLDTWLLPFVLTLPLAGLGLLASGLGLTPAGSLAAAAIGLAVGAGLFLLIHLVGERVFGREALGFGDVVLLGGLCAWLGWKAILPVILLSSLQGAVVGLAFLLLGRQRLGSREPAPDGDDWTPDPHHIPYGPFLALAALQWLLLAAPLAALLPALGVFLSP